MISENFQIAKTLKSNPKIERLLLSNIKYEILGEKYKLSLVLIGNEKSQSLNKKYRKKDKPANVLSFPLSPTDGEIFINIPMARREHKKFDMTFSKFLVYLFIHGCLHLSGLNHGKKMEELEIELLKKYFK